MNENEWVEKVIELVKPRLKTKEPLLQMGQGERLPYAYEIRSYSETGNQKEISSYQTDILVTEHHDDAWLPRVVIEAKIDRVTTHDAITYSQKAITHKQVHPYLRYGIIIGNRKHHTLPGRLFRHGAYFDFMQSWVGYEPTKVELSKLIQVILKEVEASRIMEEILYTSRKPGRKKFTLLHRPLHLE